MMGLRSSETVTGRCRVPVMGTTLLDVLCLDLKMHDTTFYASCVEAYFNTEFE